MSFFFVEMLHLRRSFSTGLVDFKSYFGCCLITPKKKKASRSRQHGRLVCLNRLIPRLHREHGTRCTTLLQVFLQAWDEAAGLLTVRTTSWVWKMMATLFIVMPWSCVILLRLRNKWMVADGLAGMLSALVSGAAREIRLWHAHSGGLRKNY